MKILVIVPPITQFSRLKHLELECEGSGTEQDPAIITASEQLPDFFRIINTHLYIKIINCYTSIIISGCTNISIINCKFKLLAFEKCAKMKIRDCIIKRSSVSISRELEFEGCSFKKLKIRQSRILNFTNCSIAKLKEVENRVVTFKNTSIQKKDPYIEDPEEIKKLAEFLELDKVKKSIRTLYYGFVMDVKEIGLKLEKEFKIDLLYTRGNKALELKSPILYDKIANILGFKSLKDCWSDRYAYKNVRRYDLI